MADKKENNETKSKASSISDNPSDIDRLGYDPYVAALSRILKDSKLQTPYTVGIYGRWGTGKSTFMHLLSKSLQEDDFLCIPFQPWQFDGKEEVWKSLIMTVVRRLEKEDEIIDGLPAHGAQINEIVKGVTKLALNQVVKSWTGGSFDFDKLVEFWTKPENDNTQFLNAFRNKFGELRDNILLKKKGQKRRLFIFVDDLDRCTPESCIMVLEAVKLFFDMEDCVFILGIDSAIVQQGIEFKYDKKINIAGQDYLEKLIQLPFSLPAIKKETFDNYVLEITEIFELNENIQKLVTIASEGNPRQVKLLTNCLNLIQTVAKELLSRDASFKASDQIKLAVLLVLQARFPLAFRWFVKFPKPIKLLLEDRQTFFRELSDYIKPNYGGNSDSRSNSFFDLLQFVSSLEEFKDFQNESEINEYLQITGLVAETETPIKGITGRDKIDNSLAMDKFTSKSNPEPDEQPDIIPTGIDPTAIDENWLTQKIEEFIGTWKRLRYRRTITLLWANTENIVSDVKKLLRLTSQLKNLLNEFQNINDKHKMHIINETLDTIDEHPMKYANRKLKKIIPLIIGISFIINFFIVLSFESNGGLDRVFTTFSRISFFSMIMAIPTIPSVVRIIQVTNSLRLISNISFSEKDRNRFIGNIKL